MQNAISRPAFNLTFRSLGRADLRQMLHIFREAISASQLARSIYTAHGAETFFSRLLDYPKLQKQEQFWGVELEGKGLVGAAHTRLMGDSHHLNNYAVLPAFQGRGIGAKMMEHWHGLARSQQARTLSLDVALENEGARRHYTSFGFTEVSRRNEYRWEGTADGSTFEAQLQDWPLAEVSFQTYGFGRFTLAIGNDRWTVNLRAKDFRVSSTDPRLLAVLQQMNPAHTIFLHTPDVIESSSAWTYTGSLLRMTKKLPR